MLEGIHFSYDGIKSVDMGLINCKIDGGMFKEGFLPSRTINEAKIAGRDKPYFVDIEYKPLEFELTFAFEERYNEKKIREVARWLNQDYYKPFYTTDNPNRIYYCMLVGDSDLVHNGLKEGYITLKFRCDGAYSYQPTAVIDDMNFKSSKLVKNHMDSTFNSGTMMSNMELSNGKLKLTTKPLKWSDFSGKKWSEL